jgi:hypothetical protein
VTRRPQHRRQSCRPPPGYVLDSDWGERQPRAEAQNAYLENHSWDEYAEWHLGLSDGATDGTQARYAFVSAISAATGPA